MYISKIKIENYKGFNNHDTIELKQGINLIIGKNNSGKTALLEALTFSVNKPHLSEINKPRLGSFFEKNTKISGKLTLTYQNFINFIEDNLRSEVILPYEVVNCETLTWLSETDYYHDGLSDDEDFIEPLFRFNREVPTGSENWSEDDWLHYDINEHEKLMSIGKEAYNEENAEKIEITEINDFIDSFFQEGVSFKFNQSKFSLSFPNDKNIENNEGLNVKLRVREGKLEFRTRFVKETINSCEKIVSHFVKKHIYKFDVFRKFYSKSSVHDETKLSSDCSNLISVLHKYKNSDPKSFEKYKKALKNILGIEELIFETVESSVEIKIWNTESIEGRSDLAINLDDCGTGVGQVLSILYVVISSRESKVILIDEPNSFLHPSASRKLLEVLTEYPQHQYVITTHSPELISNFGDNILHTQLVNGEINAKQIDKKDKEQIGEIFSDLGIRLSDVYGFDSIFWVEGETEEKCLPLILKNAGIDISNTKFQSVRETGGTGKFDKDIDTIVQIYNKLSSLNDK